MRFVLAIISFVMIVGTLIAGDVPHFQAGNTKIIAPWIRATSGHNGAAFMILQNPEGDALTGAHATKNGESICDTVELHAHLREGDVMRMREVPEIKVEAETHLKPGGLHIMFMGLKNALVDDETINLSLKFVKGGEVVVTVKVSLRNPY